MERLIGLLPGLRAELAAAANPDDAVAMAAYMKGQFPILGVKTPDRRRVSKAVLAAGSDGTEDELLELADACWVEPEREFQYVAVDLLRKWAGSLSSSSLVRVERLITTKSWWDTVDGLAAWTVGPLVAADPVLVAVMDQWIESDDIWLARTAIIHQLGYKDDTDAERLFRYVGRRAGDTDFFIRKASGWALRQYGRVDPDAVRRFVADHEDDLSPLTKREALKRL